MFQIKKFQSQIRRVTVTSIIFFNAFFFIDNNILKSLKIYVYVNAIFLNLRALGDSRQEFPTKRDSKQGYYGSECSPLLLVEYLLLNFYGFT